MRGEFDVDMDSDYLRKAADMWRVWELVFEMLDAKCMRKDVRVEVWMLPGGRSEARWRQTMGAVLRGYWRKWPLRIIRLPHVKVAFKRRSSIELGSASHL